MVQRHWLVVGLLAILAIAALLFFTGSIRPVSTPTLDQLEAELNLENVPPGTVLTSPFVVQGVAVPEWFNESGEIVGELFDDEGALLWSGKARMTGDVGWGGRSFEATLKFVTPSTTRGTLKFIRSNPVLGTTDGFTHGVTVLFVEPDVQ